MPLISKPILRPATSRDLDAAKKLLEAESLPTLGVEEHFDHYTVAELDDRIVGLIGLEIHGDTGLLRSAVVDRAFHGHGIGRILSEQLMQKARTLRLGRLVLLTNTAEKYFERLGFRKVARESITGPVTSSVEFTDACPAHAACMELVL